MAWYYNVKAAQAVRQQAAQQKVPPQNVVNGTGSPNQPLGPDPASSANVVKQVPASATSPAKTYIRKDYRVASSSTVTEEGGNQRTTLTLEPVVKSQVSSPALSNDLFSGNRQTLGFSSDGKPVQPIINTNEKREIAVEVLATVMAPVFGPELLVSRGVGSTAMAISSAAGRAAAKQIIIGEVVGAGLSMAPNIYNAATGKEVTLTEYAKAGLEGAAIGGVFSVVGGKAVQLAGQAIGGVTGSVVSQGALKVQQATISQELAGIGVRTGVNMGLGAGAGAGLEYVQTGQVTEKTVILGAAFGAAFSAGGELAGLGAPAVHSKMIGSIPGQRIQARLNEYYVYGSDRNFNLGLGDKVLAKATGLQPQKPAPEAFVFKDVVTARESEYVTVRPDESKLVDSSIIVSKRAGGEPFIDVMGKSGLSKVREVSAGFSEGAKESKFLGEVSKVRGKSEVVDVIGFKEEVPVGEYKFEKADVLNMNPDKTRVVREAELWDPSQMAVGRSVSRESILLESESVRVRAKKVGGADLEKYGLTSEELTGLRSEIDLTGGKLSFNKKYEPMTGDLLKPQDLASPHLRKNLDFVGKVGGPIESEPVSFGYKELQRKIRAGEYEGVLNPANENKALDKSLAEAYRNVEAKDYGSKGKRPKVTGIAKAEDRQIAIEALEKYGVVAGGKGEVALKTEKSVRGFEEVVSKQHLENLVTERATSLGRTSTQAANPMVAYAGPSYYGNVNREVEEESVVLSYPKGGLAAPESITKTRQLTDRYSRVGYGLGGVSGAYGLGGVLGVSVFDTENRLAPGFIPMVSGRVTGIVTPKVQSFSIQENIQRSGYGALPDSGLDLGQRQDPIGLIDIVNVTMPIETPITEPIGETPIYETPFPQPFNYTQLSKGSYFKPDFKFEAGGFGDSFGRKRGVKSRRKRYPILSAKEFLGL
jgi:hypothetical protein